MIKRTDNNPRINIKSVMTHEHGKSPNFQMHFNVVAEKGSLPKVGPHQPFWSPPTPS